MNQCRFSIECFIFFKVGVKSRYSYTTIFKCIRNQFMLLSFLNLYLKRDFNHFYFVDFDCAKCFCNMCQFTEFMLSGVCFSNVENFRAFCVKYNVNRVNFINLGNFTFVQCVELYWIFGKFHAFHKSLKRFVYFIDSFPNVQQSLKNCD